MDNQEKVQEIVDILKNKHGSKYTPLQVRIWAELIASGLHPNSEQPPPTNSMFERAGTGGSSKPNQKDNSVVKVVADAASAITCALTKTAQSPGPSLSVTSPAKLIEGRSKLYKQLSELQNLKSMGVLSDNEYLTEKETIMELLKNMYLQGKQLRQ